MNNNNYRNKIHDIGYNEHATSLEWFFIFLERKKNFFTISFPFLLARET